MDESSFEKKLTECPVCLNEEPATFWNVINGDSDPDLKDRLLRKQVHQQVCSNCGHTFILQHPLLYLEPSRRLMIYCHAGLPAADIQGRQAALPAPAGWTLRLAADYNQLIEKIHLSDHCCDDRIMELVKLAVLRQQAANAVNAGSGQGDESEDHPEPGMEDDVRPFKTLYFLTADDHILRFMALDQDEQWLSFDLDSTAYLNTEQLLAGRLEDNTARWQTIGGDYAAEWLHRLAAEP
ncbi:MAG: CpXC domain-containing protein [Clostridiaceae bacterium]|nr:CpXC domain-containing protein [Clostridiaceae bacterium]